MGVTEWLVLGGAVFLAMLFLVAEQRRTKARLLIVLGVMGFGLISYAYVAAYVFRKPGGVFAQLGFPMSVAAVGILCFVALVFESAFDQRQLRRFVYPTLCAYFALWFAIDTVVFLLSLPH